MSSSDYKQTNTIAAVATQASETIAVRIIGATERLCLVIAGTLLVGLVLSTTLDATLRYFLGAPIRGLLEFTTDFSMPMIIFLALPSCYRLGGNIRITLLTQRIRGRPQAVLNVVVQIIVAVTAFLMTYALLQQLVRNFELGSMRSGAISYAIWPSYAAVFFGLALTSVMIVMDMRNAASGTAGTFAGDVE